MQAEIGITSLKKAHILNPIRNINIMYLYNVFYACQNQTARRL